MNIKEFFSWKNYSNYLLFLLLVAGAVLRFYNLPKRYGFDFDAARDSLAASIFSENLSLPLTGAASSVAPFNFGPWYYWGLIIFEKIIPIYGSWFFITLAGLVSILIVYKLGDVLENRNLGLILASIFTFSPSQIILSTTLSNPSVIPVFSALVIMFFLSYLKTKKLINVFLLSLFLSMGATIHFQLVGFIIFPILVLVFYNNKLRNFLVSLLGFLFPLVPVFIYEINHNFYNLKGLIFYFTETSGNVYVANRWLFYARDFWPKFWSETLGVGLPITIIILISCGLLFVYLMHKKQFYKKHLMILIAFLFNYILLRYFPSQKPIYYLYFLQIFIYLFTGFLFYKLLEHKRFKILGGLVFLAFLILILNKDINIVRSESANREAISFVNNVDEDVNLFFCDYNGTNFGIIYLLKNKNLLSESGKKIKLGNCANYKSALSIDPNELKNMQVHKTY